MTTDLWEVRNLHDDVSLELCSGTPPGLVLVQGSDRIKAHALGCWPPAGCIMPDLLWLAELADGRTVPL